MTAPTIPADAASTPCPWTVPLGNPCCSTCSGWDSASPELQAVATAWATTFLWAATGRRFNECEVIVRPCGSEPCQDGTLNYFGWGWGNGSWLPYIWNGNWFNCSCNGRCTCKPMSEIRLLGPVQSIVEITLGADIIDPDTYWVDDGHWLVRKSPDRWPECNDMNSLDGDEVLTVTYIRGDGVPDPLRYAAAKLRCEYIKACNNDSSCQLSAYVQSISRAGVDFTMIPYTELLANNLTGIAIVDTTISFYNPYGLKQRGRIYAPELMVPRQSTWPV
jgi:hypothetical protein